MIQLNIEAPWQTWVKELKALFKGDPDIEVTDITDVDNVWDANYVVSVLVRDHQKFIALDRMMPRLKTFGNVTLAIDLYDEENSAVNVLDLFNTIFKGNPRFDGCIHNVDPAGGDWNYVMFKPEVVQFRDDDIGDANGLWSGLAEDIARDIFSENARGVFFCTSPVESDELPE